MAMAAGSAIPAPPGHRLASAPCDEGYGTRYGCESPLTPRQLAVLGCVCEGLTNFQTAARLGVSHNTIKWHLKQMSRLLGAANRCALVYRARRRGLI
jgi:DNA-binding NarL/FixJ family response regulator